MVIFALIFANMVVMAVEHYGMSEDTQEILEYCNMTFIFLFTMGKAIIYIIGRPWFTMVPIN
jgi:hypothetical protein